MSPASVPAATLVVLADLHVRLDGPLHGRVDTVARLEDALAAVDAAQLEPAALVLCGDLADDGDPAAYARIADVVEKWSARVGAEVVALPGNHDDLGAVEAPVDRGVRLAGGALRVVVLDTTRPGRDTGHVEPDQLAWLEAELAREPGVPVVVAMHHTPLATPDPFSAGLGVEDPGPLAAVLAEADDVRLVVCGHTHKAVAGTLGGRPVVTAPALSYGADALSPAGVLRTYDLGGLLRVDLHPGGDVVATPVALPVARTVLTERPLAEHLARLDELRAQGRA